MQTLQANDSLNELQFFIHDIKSPLTNLGINLETLRSQLKDMPINYEQSINSALRSLDYINNYIHTYKNNFENSFSWFNVSEEIDYLISNHFEMRFNQSNIKFHIYSSSNNLIFGNRFDFRRLIFNLLNNSCDALEMLPRKQRRIQLSMSKQTKDMIIKIIDNGPGISNCSNVFEAGYTTKQNHLGIGLNLVHQIVREFKGEITVTSQPFETTCFQLRLPTSNN